ncbi:MAG: IPTL-CTERM sorting domain-containing protein, partial [Chloroflexi bacterium]
IPPWAVVLLCALIGGFGWSGQ